MHLATKHWNAIHGRNYLCIFYGLVCFSHNYLKLDTDNKPQRICNQNVTARGKLKPQPTNGCKQIHYKKKISLRQQNYTSSSSSSKNSRLTPFCMVLLLSIPITHDCQRTTKPQQIYTFNINLHTRAPSSLTSQEVYM